MEDSTLIYILGGVGTILVTAGKAMKWLNSKLIESFETRFQDFIDAIDELKQDRDSLKVETQECKEERDALFLWGAHQTDTDPVEFREKVRASKKEWDEESDGKRRMLSQ